MGCAWSKEAGENGGAARVEGEKWIGVRGKAGAGAFIYNQNESMSIFIPISDNQDPSKFRIATHGALIGTNELTNCLTHPGDRVFKKARLQHHTWGGFAALPLSPPPSLRTINLASHAHTLALIRILIRRFVNSRIGHLIRLATAFAP